MSNPSDAILLSGKIKKAILGFFPEYVFNRTSGFQLRTFTDDKDNVAIRMIYRITGSAASRFSAVEKRNAKMRNLREYTQHLLSCGYSLSEHFQSNGKASYMIGKASLMESRVASFDSLQMNSLMVADGEDPENLENLYLVSSYWHGKERPEFRLKSMRYGVQLADTYTPIEAANYGYMVIGVLSDVMVERMEKWWSSTDKVHMRMSDIVKEPPVVKRKKKNCKQWKLKQSERMSYAQYVEKGNQS